MNLRERLLIEFIIRYLEVINYMLNYKTKYRLEIRNRKYKIDPLDYFDSAEFIFKKDEENCTFEKDFDDLIYKLEKSVNFNHHSVYFSHDNYSGELYYHIDFVNFDYNICYLESRNPSFIRDSYTKGVSITIRKFVYHDFKNDIRETFKLNALSISFNDIELEIVAKYMCSFEMQFLNNKGIVIKCQI